MDFLEHLPVPYHDLMVKGFFLPALLIDPVCHSPYGQSQDPVEGKGHHQREDKGGDAQDKCNGRFLDPGMVTDEYFIHHRNEAEEKLKQSERECDPVNDLVHFQMKI